MKVILISAKAQNGKDQSATFLKEIIEKDNKKVLIIHYADLLKFICKNMFDWNGEKDENGRTLLQRIGTEVIRKQNPDYWVDFICQFLLMFTNEWDYVIIPDTRFPNEIEKMKKYFNTYALRIHRIDFENNLTEEQKKHISETALDDYEFDYEIHTISDLKCLWWSLVEMYDEELKNYKRSE